MTFYTIAQIVESGKYYHAGVAIIYVKHAGNKIKSAECYENGKMTHEVIESLSRIK